MILVINAAQRGATALVPACRGSGVEDLQYPFPPGNPEGYALRRSPHFSVNVRPGVTPVSDVSRCPGGRYAETTMLKIAGGHAKVFSVFLVSIGLLALVALAFSSHNLRIVVVREKLKSVSRH